MKVSDLIEKLKILPQELPVYTSGDTPYGEDKLLLDVHSGLAIKNNSNEDITEDSVLLITTDYSNFVSDEEWASPTKENFKEMMVRYVNKRATRPKDLTPWPSLAKEVEIYKKAFKDIEHDTVGKLIADFIIKVKEKEQQTQKQTIDEAFNELLKPSALQVEDLSSKFIPLLSEDLQLPIQTKVEHQISFDYICKYHSVIVKKGEEEKAIKKLAEDIQIVNEKVKIVGTLSPCSSLSLCVETEQMPSVAVFVFIAIKLEDSDEYDRLFQGKLISSITEGDCGKVLD